MLESRSRRSFIAGALAAGGLSAAATRIFVDSGAQRTNVRLRLLTGTDPTGTRGLLISMWNQLNPGATIEPVTTAGSTAVQRRAFANSDGADIYNLDVVHLQEYVNNRVGLHRIRRPPDSVLSPVVQAACQADTADTLWALPFNADVGMLFRRIRVDGPSGEKPGWEAVLTKTLVNKGLRRSGSAAEIDGCARGRGGEVT